MCLFYRLLVAVLCLVGSAQAKIPVLELGAVETAPLHVHAEVLEDSSEKLTLADVLQPHNDQKFQAVTMTGIDWQHFYSDSAYWFRLKVRNSSQEKGWNFFQWVGLSQSLAVYLAVNEEGSRPQFRELEPIKRTIGASYAINLSADEEYIVYYRIQDKFSALGAWPILRPTTHELDGAKNYSIAVYFLLGGLFILALYNFLYFLHLRDQGFLVLGLFILCFTFEMGGSAGFLWQVIPWLQNYTYLISSCFGALATAFGILLFRQWLYATELDPKLDYFWRCAFWGSIGLAVIFPAISHDMLILLAWLFCLALPGLYTFILFYRRGRRLPHIILLAAVVVFLGITPAVLYVLEISFNIHLNIRSVEVYLAESALMGLLLSLMLLSTYQAAQIRARNEQVERIAAANQARDEFLTTMSHELRTPMSSVVSAGQLLNLSTLSTDQSAYVSRLNTSSKHMLSLINNILDLARLEQSNQTEQLPFKLEDIVQQVEQLLAEQVKSRSIKFVVDSRLHLLKKHLLGDPVWLRQVLLNLLNNAIKFTEKGEVRLTITPQAIDTEVTLLFEIQDTGIGIAKARQAELFQPFTQADNSTSRVYGGSGLGLAISHKLVSRMGGTLQLESEPGQGSRFFFTLSFQMEETAPEIKPSQAMVDTKLTHTTWQALLIDDNEMNRFFNSRLLKSLGVNVTTVDSGQQALQRLQQEAFDLIFIDVNMPEMDGYETTRLIHETLPGEVIKIIALTAHAISGEKRRCLVAGMDDYLAKPFTRQELEAVLHEHGFLNPLMTSQQR